MYINLLSFHMFCENEIQSTSRLYICLVINTKFVSETLTSKEIYTKLSNIPLIEKGIKIVRAFKDIGSKAQKIETGKV